MLSPTLPRVLLASLVIFAARKPAFSSDVRLSITQVNATYNGAGITFGAGGRVGNARKDGTVVLDANFQGATGGQIGYYQTEIFSIPQGGAALTLLSVGNYGPRNMNAWQSGDSTSPPSPGVYLGNPWYCPTSGSASGAYMLFQAQNAGSNVGVAAQPGSGSDNDVWLYRPPVSGSTQATVWKVTNYGISGTAYLGPGVLGPQCSQDTDSAAGVLHVVYGHQIVGPPNPTQSGTTNGLQCSGGHGPSDGTCWWFG